MSTYNNRRSYERRSSTRRTSGSSGSRGGKRRPPKKRIRYDRVAGAAVVFILLIIILVACGKSCGGSDTKEEESSIVPTESKEQSQTNGSDSGVSEDSGTSLLENYSTVTQAPGNMLEGDLILVNKQHEYSFPTDEEAVEMVYGSKTDSYQVADLETYLAPRAITALNSLMDAFYAEKGRSDCIVISGFRTKDYQDELFNSGTTDIKGGCSDYHTGLSFDLGVYPDGESSYYYTPEGDYAWINDNCAKYGFVLRFPEGKEAAAGVSESKSYQFRYVGIPHAICMKENNLCLEEYTEFVKNYTYDGDHLKVAGPDKNYEVYYVEANLSGDTEVPVPAGKEYTISGNNADGFVVAVELS